MTLSIRNIIPIIKANWFGNNDISIIDTISIDSRSLQNGENTLFFAISGPNHDGHQYIEDLISKGVQNFVVTHFDENQLIWRLQLAIKSLPEKQQLVFNLRYYDEMPYQQMSELLDTSEGALKASYHHAAKKIEEFIKSY